MLIELEILLKEFNKITVLTDSWYAEENLMKYITVNCKWNWISAIKSNRTIDGEQVKSKFWWIANKLDNASMNKSKEIFDFIRENNKPILN